MAILAANRRPGPSGEKPEPPPEGAQETAEETIARLGVALEQQAFDLDLSRRSEARLRERVRELEEDLATVEEIRSTLRQKVEERDRLLSVIFESRSWKLMQALRSFFGRS